MAKNITPKVNKDYAVYSVNREWISFHVTSICGETVHVDWTSDNPRNYPPMFSTYDFLNQDGANYHICELNTPEEFLALKLKYTSK